MSRLVRFLVLVLTIVLTVVLVGCASAPVKQPNLPPPVETSSLGPGDVIEVTVYDEPSMSKPFKVAPNGTIDFPLVGTLEIEGKEPQEVAELIKVRLRDGKILKNPSVSVLVKEVNSKKFAVFGQVQKPGQFPMTEGMTVTQAISLAGGFTALADRDRITLNRRVSRAKVVRVVFSVAAITEGKMNDIPLQSGDTIYVEERVF
ncbi:MAG: polysaccharide export protein [Deltaproteobacteria bacterium]|nr:polysaccharide export protein [Deltaproteobacteria bacterium]